MSICDLIPQRRWTVLVWFLICATVIAAHGALEAACQSLRRYHLGIDLSPLSLCESHNLANFTLCLSWLLATIYAALVVNFRRHKVDDYRGRYRLWYYICAGLFLAATGSGAGLSRTLDSAALRVAADGRVSSAPMWTFAAIAILCVGLGIRLLIEIRESRGAVACLVAAAVSVGMQAALQFDVIRLQGDDLQAMLLTLAQLCSVQMLLLALVVYARYVLMDAQGIALRRARPSLPRLHWRRIRTADAATGRPKPQPKPAGLASQQSSTTSDSKPRDSRIADDDSDDEASDEGQATIHLSRADRRRLRKEKRRQQHAA
jgi:hypothetical protein